MSRDPFQDYSNHELGRFVRGREWALKASTEERRAVLVVRLLVSVLLLIDYMTQRTSAVIYRPIYNLHEHLHAFVNEIGIVGPIYETTDGMCPAAHFYDLFEGKEESSGDEWQPFGSVVQLTGEVGDVEKKVTKQAKALGIDLPLKSLVAAGHKFLEVADPNKVTT